ncbi:MAG: hypothetical protein LBT04_00720 [Prevotellaceae bacterium]|jgi:hypothetical protein|nr:hypothetical protein [Prevotellaceae bacterium]
MEVKREINLFEMFIALGRGMKNLFWGLINFVCQIFKLTVQYFWITVSVTMLSVLLGFFSTTNSKTIYKGTTTILFSKEAKAAIINEFEVLNTLNTLDSKTLAKQLNISVNEARSIFCFRTYPVVDMRHDSIPDLIAFKFTAATFADSINPVMPDRLGLQISLIGAQKFDNLLNGLVTYFNENKRIARIDEASKSMLDEKIDFCIKELDRLDRFSEYDYFGGNKKTLIREGITIEPARKDLYYKNMRELLKEKDYLISVKASTPDVINFISDKFFISTFPRLYTLIIFGILGFAVSLIIAVIFKKRKNIVNFLKTKD